MTALINDHTLVTFSSPKSKYKPDVLKKLLENKEVSINPNDDNSVLVKKELGKVGYVELMNLRNELLAIPQDFGDCTKTQYEEQIQLCTRNVEARLRKWDGSADILSMNGF